jgi:hypothetical protein
MLAIRSDGPDAGIDKSNKPVVCDGEGIARKAIRDRLGLGGAGCDRRLDLPDRASGPPFRELARHIGHLIHDWPDWKRSTTRSSCLPRLLSVIAGKFDGLPRPSRATTPQQRLISLPKLAVLPFEGLQPVGHLGRNAGPLPAVNLGLLDPVMQRLRCTADLARNRGHRRPARPMLARVIQKPSESRGPGPRMKTCSSSCLSWLHPLRSLEPPVQCQSTCC